MPWETTPTIIPLHRSHLCIPCSLISIVQCVGGGAWWVGGACPCGHSQTLSLVSLSLCSVVPMRGEDTHLQMEIWSNSSCWNTFKPISSIYFSNPFSILQLIPQYTSVVPSVYFSNPLSILQYPLSMLQ